MGFCQGPFEEARKYLDKIDYLNQKIKLIQMQAEKKNAEATPSQGMENIKELASKLTQIIYEIKALIPPPELESYHKKTLAHAEYTVTYYQSLDQYRELYPVLIKKRKDALTELKKTLSNYSDCPRQYSSNIDLELKQLDSNLYSKTENLDAEPILKLIESQPENYQNYIDLANFYLTSGQGDLAVENAEKALRLSPEEAAAKGAYLIAASGSYYAGRPQASFDYVDKALLSNPGDKEVLSFKQMLEAVKQEQWGGKVPKQLSFDGYESVDKLLESVASEGKATLGSSRDDFISEDLYFSLEGPKDWEKEADLKIAGGTRVLLQYKKQKESRDTIISVTKDKLPEEDKALLDFAKRVRQSLMQRAQASVILGPYLVMVGDKEAALTEFKFLKKNSYFRFYQFLVNNTVLTFNYSNTLDDFEQDLPAFERVVKSIIFKKQ